ncbi:MAG TPA: glycosyltransferase family 4 protein [Candidatus Limnocylindrales bacterium]|nr:glycosyltransferase family 4 protein [Candidatus Limnocylindrales bacterium]
MTLGASTEAVPRPPGVRVVLDVRALQEPTRAPRTAAYLDNLLTAFDADPLPGESFAFLLASDEDDPTTRFTNLEVIGRRLLPPIRLLRSGALTIDPFLLRGASLGAAWRARDGGAAGAVYHTAGGGLPIASRLPTVATLLDLAPWQLPDPFQRTAASRFGQRLRGQLLRDAAAVLVGTDAVATAARRLLRIRAARLRVVPLAPSRAYAMAAAGRGRDAAAARRLTERLGLGERYLVYPGRHDARHDASTLMSALARLSRSDRPDGLAAAIAWPPRVLVLEATPDDRAALARVAARHDATAHVVYAPALPPDEEVAIVAGSRAIVLPMIAESTGLAALDAITVGVPVIASAVGALPEVVGTAGILVEPRDPDRLAAALTAAWGDDAVQRTIAAAARGRSRDIRRTWADVAADVRRIYAEVGVHP